MGLGSYGPPGLNFYKKPEHSGEGFFGGARDWLRGSGGSRVEQTQGPLGQISVGQEELLRGRKESLHTKLLL